MFDVPSYIVPKKQNADNKKMSPLYKIPFMIENTYLETILKDKIIFTNGVNTQIKNVKMLNHLF